MATTRVLTTHRLLTTYVKLRVAHNQIKSMYTFPDRRVAIWACTAWGFILVGVWVVVVWVLWFLVNGLFLVVVGLGVGCLVVGWVGWCFFYGCSPWWFFVLGVGGCWLFVGLPRFLQPFSSASRGPPWRCLRWLLGVWFIWFSRTSPGRVLVFRLPFHIVCIGGLGICFCGWLWRPAFCFCFWM